MAFAHSKNQLRLLEDLHVMGHGWLSKLDALLNVGRTQPCFLAQGISAFFQ